MAFDEKEESPVVKLRKRKKKDKEDDEEDVTSPSRHTRRHKFRGSGSRSSIKLEAREAEAAVEGRGGTPERVRASKESRGRVKTRKSTKGSDESVSKRRHSTKRKKEEEEATSPTGRSRLKHSTSSSGRSKSPVSPSTKDVRPAPIRDNEREDSDGGSRSGKRQTRMSPSTPKRSASGGGRKLNRSRGKEMEPLRRKGHRRTTSASLALEESPRLVADESKPRRSRVRSSEWLNDSDVEVKGESSSPVSHVSPGASRRTRRSRELSPTVRKLKRLDKQKSQQEVQYEVKTLFSEGFLSYYREGVITDVTLLFNGKHYPAHRLILAHGSRYFYRLLKENGDDIVSVTLPPMDYDAVSELFEDVVAYLYSGTIDFTPERSLPLLVVADAFELDHLHQLAVGFISQNIERESALETLRQAMKFNIRDIHVEATAVIAKNFSYIYDADYSSFPPEVFLGIVSSPMLNVRKEFVLFKHVQKYASTRVPPVSEDDVTKMMACIRFGWFSVQELRKAQQDVRVPREMLLEASLAKLEGVGGGVARENFGISMEYKSRYKAEDLCNCKGILYWLSTDCGRRARRNPHTTGHVRVTASSVEKGNPEELVGEQPCELWTKDVPSSWFCLDFGATRRVRANFYSLRHGGNHRADSLRTWDLQASNNLSDWVLLRRHANDVSLDGAFSVGSWPVSAEQIEPFRYFRILQTGHNSSINNFLVASGVELYGTLYEIDSTE